MDIYTEHHPHHEIGPIEHLKYVGAQYYTTLLSRLTSHIKNEDVHVSNEDRYKWDNKADKTALRELEMKMAELTPSSDKDDIDLSTYATHTWVDENFARKGYYPTYEDLSSRYALKTDIPSVADLATKVYVDNAIANIKPGGSTDMSGYATKLDVLSLDDFVESAVNGLQDQINNIDQFTLSPASDKTLGGIKTGSTPGGNGDYPVLMNGEFAYVHIPISSTSEDVIITSMYSIHPIMSDVKISDNGVLQGSVTWSVTKHEGQSSSTVIFPSQDVTTYAVLLPQNERLEMLPFGRSGSEEVTAVCEWADGNRTSGDFIQIFVKKDTTIVATSTIPVIKTGKNGKDGTTTIEYQSLSFPVVRLCGEYMLGTTYYSGDTTVNGVAYIDIVSYEGALYKAAKTGLNSTPMTVQGEWEPFSIYGQNAFYNLLIANQAFITALASKQIVVVDNEGKPVAGLLSNDATITTETGTFQRSGVRIFAGANDGNIAASPFRVYDDGSVAIDNGSFTLKGANGEFLAIADRYTDLAGSGKHPDLLLKGVDNFGTDITAYGIKLSDGNTGKYTDINPRFITTPELNTQKINVNGILDITGSILLNGAPFGSSSTGMNMWIDLTGDVDPAYTFEIKGGVVVGFHKARARDLANVGDCIVEIDVRSGEFASYRLDLNGNQIRWFEN